MRAFTVLTCLALAGADIEPLVMSDIQAVAPVTELRSSTKVVSKELWVANETAVVIDDRSSAALVDMMSSTDLVCLGAEKTVQSILQAACNVSNVACVYCKDCLKCDDWCNPSADCGYVQDNPFVKFHDYECSVKLVSSGKVDGSITCKPEFTPTCVGAIIAAVLLSLACCSGCAWWCCCRRRR